MYLVLSYTVFQLPWGKADILICMCIMNAKVWLIAFSLSPKGTIWLPIWIWNKNHLLFRNGHCTISDKDKRYIVSFMTVYGLGYMIQLHRDNKISAKICQIKRLKPIFINNCTLHYYIQILFAGVLLWEWSLTLQNEDHADFSEWWVQNNMLVHMVPVFASHIEVTVYNLFTGQNKGSTSKLPAPWSHDGWVKYVSGLKYCDGINISFYHYDWYQKLHKENFIFSVSRKAVVIKF